MSNLTRYKRNHELIELIFTPKNTEALYIPPVFHQTKQELLKLKSELDEELLGLKAEHQTRIESFRVKANEDWKLLKSLSH
jgi:hypothetical protein